LRTCYVEREQYPQDWTSYPWVSRWKYSCNLFRLFNFLNASSFFCKMCVWICVLVACWWHNFEGEGQGVLEDQVFFTFQMIQTHCCLLQQTTHFFIWFWKPTLEWVEQHNLVGHTIQGLVATLDRTMINFSLILLLKITIENNLCNI
jgi:hypothetical protein